MFWGQLQSEDSGIFLSLNSLGKVVAKEGGDLDGKLKLLLDLGLVSLVALGVELGVSLLASGCSEK